MDYSGEGESEGEKGLNRTIYIYISPIFYKYVTEGIYSLIIKNTQRFLKRERISFLLIILWLIEAYFFFHKLSRK